MFLWGEQEHDEIASNDLLSRSKLSSLLHYMNQHGLCHRVDVRIAAHCTVVMVAHGYLPLLYVPVLRITSIDMLLIVDKSEFSFLSFYNLKWKLLMRLFQFFSIGKK